MQTFQSCKSFLDIRDPMSGRVLEFLYVVGRKSGLHNLIEKCDDSYPQMVTNSIKITSIGCVNGPIVFIFVCSTQIQTRIEQSRDVRNRVRR
jgi:hypothetical protein